MSTRDSNDKLALQLMLIAFCALGIVLALMSLMPGQGG